MKDKAIENKSNKPSNPSSASHYAAQSNEIGRVVRGKTGDSRLEDRKLGRAALSVSEGRLSPVLPFIAFCIIALIAIYALLWPEAILDHFRRLNYEMPPEISALASNLPLTDSAKSTFTATHPSLDDRDHFNEHCHSHDSEISVLGCYTDSSIYLYDIKSDELTGIVESTAAHELLHAAWSRLPFWEKSAITSEIQDFYSTHSAELSADLENYAEEDRLDELHSRIGTEFANLPEALEAHYAKYFTDQDAVVTYYDSYSAKFLELKDQIEELDTALDEQKSAIDQLRDQYESTYDDLNAKIDEFNSCAQTVNCYTESEFTKRRSELLSAQSDLESLLSELNSKIDSYNTLIDEYNANVLRSRTLENAVNSNSTPIESL